LPKNQFLLKTQLRNFASRGWVWPIHVLNSKQPFFVYNPIEEFCIKRLGLAHSCLKLQKNHFLFKTQLKNFASRGWVWSIHVLNCKKPFFVEDLIEEFCIKRLGLAHSCLKLQKNHFLLKIQLKNFASRGWVWPIHVLNCKKTIFCWRANWRILHQEVGFGQLIS
jgi:hypothetical protein